MATTKIIVVLLLWMLKYTECKTQTRPRIESNGSHKHHELLHNFVFNSVSTPTSLKNNILINASAVPIIYVTDYGADPTGSTDSFHAFSKAISVALSYGYGGNLSYGISDCGGATISLGGGDYLLSSPLIIPQYYANIIITDGTIRASKSFQSNTNSPSYLLTIGDDNNGKNKCSNVCNQNIAIENMMFDCQYNINCFGGINIKSTEGAIIGPEIIIIRFTGAGITIDSGHGTVIFQTWLGEFALDDRYPSNKTSTATAIQLHGPDNTVSNTVIWSAHIGIHMKSSSNILDNIHVFGTGYSHNDTGILIDSSIHSRIVNCYLDFTHLVIATHIRGIIIQDTYFLGGGTIVIQTTNNSSNQVEDLSIVNNLYNKGNGKTVNPIIKIDDTIGPITRLKNIIIRDNIIISDGYVQNGVHCSKALSLKNSTKWIFNFEDVLIFKNMDIQWMSYSVELNSGENVAFFQHIAQKINGTTVMVKTSQNVDAIVYMSVDQSKNFDYL
eukprot:164081_1